MAATRSCPENGSPPSVVTGRRSSERTSPATASPAARRSRPNGQPASLAHQSRKSSSAVCCPRAPSMPCSASDSVSVSTPSSAIRPTLCGNCAAYTEPSRVP